MINEVEEVKGYLEGNNISKKNIYRICFLLAKWYKECELSHAEIRKAIFDWGKRNDIFIKYDVNKIIYKAQADKTRLKDNLVVKINKSDVAEIIARFDSKNTRLVALALLCYAKAHADRDRTFNISSVSLSSWIGIDDSNLRRRYIKELIDLDYIAINASKSARFSWDGNSNKYEIKVPIHNSGDITLEGNKIKDLYFEVFI